MVYVRGAIQNCVDFAGEFLFDNRLLHTFHRIRFILVWQVSSGIFSKCKPCQEERVTIATHKQNRGTPYSFKEISIAFTLITEASVVWWKSYSPCKPGVVSSIPGFTSLVGETLNRGHVSI